MMKCQSCCSTMGTARQFELDRCEVERSTKDPSLCLKCWTYFFSVRENIRRIEAWARHEGSRRRMAEALARKADQAESRDVCREHHRRWCFVWEMTADRESLRKIIERRIMPLYANQIAFVDPGTMIGASVPAQVSVEKR